MIDARPPAAPRSGRVRSARLTDLAAVGELSRQSHGPDPAAAGMRSLGLPVGAGHISVFSLFRLPLGAFAPSDLLYVYDERGHVAGLARVEHDSVRDEWTIVELDAIDNGTAGDIRFRLVQHLLRDAGKRGGLRFHVACSDEGGNVELFMQAGFVRYGAERILYLPPGSDAAPVGRHAADGHEIRAVVPLDAVELDRLYRASTPGPVSRLEDYRLPDWERQGSGWRVPRSSLTPILRFADIEAFVEEDREGPGGLRAFCQIGVAKEEQPHYLKVITLADHDPSDLIDHGLAVIAEQSRSQRRGDRGRPSRLERGVVSAVRTYELPLDRRLEERGFVTLAEVSLLMKEVAERVKEPALVPVATR